MSAVTESPTNTSVRPRMTFGNSRKNPIMPSSNDAHLGRAAQVWRRHSLARGVDPALVASDAAPPNVAARPPVLKPLGEFVAVVAASPQGPSTAL